MLSTANLQIVLKVLIILISAVWVSLWLLKPTELWTKSWHKAEDGARKTVFGYYGLNFVVYSVPAIAVAIIGFIYLHLYAKEPRRQMRMSINKLSNPFIVYRPLGIISGSELLAVTIFIIFLVWTIYAHLSNDFKKMIPTKSLKLNTWQFKFMKVGTRLGLLAEACLALLLLPVLRGMSLFRLIGIQFEASVRYHICLGTAMILFATLHGTTTFFIWGVKHQIQDEITNPVTRVSSPARYTRPVFKLLRIIQSRPATCIVSARIFPSKAVELSLSKDPRLKYTPTSLIFLKVPSISKLQWHPFSITSSSSVDDERISVIVKGDGWWTNSLYNTILAALDSDPHQVKCLPVHVEGPYGPVSTDFLRYDSLLLVAGGIGITPFLSILQELAFIQNSKKSKLPTRIQLIYAVKNSEDISLLNPISPLLLNQSLGQSSLAVKVFVTQEERSATTLRELLHELSKVQIVNFDSKGLNYTISGFPNLPWLAGIAGFSSIVFLVALGCLNHAFLHSEKKASEKKNPSWVTDVLLICSFIIAITFAALATVIMKQRTTKKDLPPVAVKQCVDTEFGSLESKDILEDHEIHYGERPNFEDIFSQFPNQTGGSNIGVLVCGPESMKESVALSCRQHSQGFITGGGKGRKPYFSFHSLNFAL